MKLSKDQIRRACEEYDHTCELVAKAAIKYDGTLKCLAMDETDTDWQAYAAEDKKRLNDLLKHLKKLEEIIASGEIKKGA